MLSVQNVTKTIDNKTVLKDITFTIPPGSITGLLGRNGVGKTTLMRTMIGILDPEEGRVLVDDVDIHQQPSIKQTIMFVPDSPTVIEKYKVKELVTLYKAIYEKFDEAYFYELIGRFSLHEQKISRYSKGMKALLHIILAFSTKATYILLDEPTNGLDPIIKKQILQFMIEEVSERELSLLISTHHLEEIEKIADTVIMLNNGQMEGITSLEDMKGNYVKVHAIFERSFPQKLEALSNVTILEQIGRVHTVLIKGNVEETLHKFRQETPIFLEEIPTTLEDVFVHSLGGKKDVS
ncbi:ABC transporter ATP-binding protein [Priestia taiwanensis]|uniref:ABC transporter ATP-binding protein n=1 Tax=Priestia taiwanensis TaxID=1347902 RepID=A0A917AI04_9BACI|nr:ABC transporter ATP-binding protein [Priestia taiwanensis]MBM7361475.1 ABC-2 type transport system ATP-binding protein [Priestia taiwanensis]GGE54464.1 ABC transporter ATP-binding protein [Priestia taiwanensis]